MTIYLVHLKTGLTTGLRQTFNGDYPVEEFRDLHVGIEFPVDAQQYPGIWVDYDDSQPLRRAGIDHREHTINEYGNFTTYTRWRFGGTATFTVVALTSLERDRLYDELVRIMAFGLPQEDDPAIGSFRYYVENNDLMAINIDFDEITPSGNAASPGTPWGTDEIVYERTLSMELIGEFVSQGSQHNLVPLKKVITHLLPSNPLTGEVTSDPLPAYPGHPDGNSGDPNSWI